MGTLTNSVDQDENSLQGQYRDDPLKYIIDNPKFITPGKQLVPATLNTTAAFHIAKNEVFRSQKCTF